MQNKPNFRNDKMNINSAITKDYEYEPRLRPPRKQTQSNPISTQKRRFKIVILPVPEFRSRGSTVEATPPQILTHFNISLQFGCAIFYFQNKIPLAKILSPYIISFMNETYTIRSPQQAILGLTTLLLRRKAQ